MKPRIGETGRKSEKKLGKRLGAKQTLGSGALRGDKGDLRLQRGRRRKWLLEAKATEQKGFRLLHQELLKIAGEARSMGRHPAFVVSFVDKRGEPLREGSWVMVPEKLWEELVEAHADADPLECEAP